MSGIKINSSDDFNFLWQRFKEGDQRAFSFFYDLYVDDLHRYASKLTDDRELLKDTIQEIFVEFYERRDKISVPAEHLKYYLFLALKRALVKRIRRARKFIPFDPAYVPVFMADYSAEDQLVKSERENEISRKIAKAVSQLPSGQREVLYLRFNEMLGYEEVAGILDISVESVRKQVYRAIKTLKQVFGEEGFNLLLIFFSKKRLKKLSMF
jgi:RNA polymerase sigma factor (sigma-70 family)